MEERNFWAVGSKFGEYDVTDEFLENGYWYDGHSENDDDRYADILKQVKTGDILCLKASTTRGPRKKGEAKAITYLNHIGIVTNKKKILLVYG